MINSIFYFPNSESDYITAKMQQGISGRTISFVPDSNGITGKIYKNGVLYGSSTDDDGDRQTDITVINNAIDKKLTSALIGYATSSDVDRKISTAETRCRNYTDELIADKMRQLATNGDQTDYTIYVYSTDTGVRITQPGADKSYPITIPGADGRINEIISSQTTILNSLESINALDDRLTAAEANITRLNNCCTSVLSTIDTILNRITVLENRVSALETQASIQPETHSLDIAAATMSLSSSGGTFVIPDVTYDNNPTPITLQSSYISGLPVSPAWIHDFADNGYSYDANTSTSPRYADLVITYQGLSRTLSITQAGVQQQVTHTLTIANDGEISVNYELHSNYSIPTVSYDGTDVTSLITGSNLSNLPNWITAGTAGTISIAANNAPNARRNATITITYGGKTASLSVYQGEDSTIHTLDLSSYATTVNASARQISLPNVYYDLTLVLDLSNVSVTTSTGATYTNGIINIPENSTGQDKTYTITVEYQTLQRLFIITQTQHILSYDLLGTEITDTFSGAYDYTGYKAVVLYYDGVQFTTNYNDVTISGTATSFLNIERMSTAISLRFLTNYGAARSGNLTFTYNGRSVSMTVSQEAVDPAVGSFHDSGGYIWEFGLDGNGKRGGQDPYPYIYEQGVQEAITEKAAMNVIVTLKPAWNNSTTNIEKFGTNWGTLTLGSIDIDDPNYVSEDTYNAESGGYIITKRWSSSKGLVIGIHLAKWTAILTKYNNLTRTYTINEDIINGTSTGTVTVTAAPMKDILVMADNVGPRHFNLTVTDPSTNYSVTYDVVQYANHGIYCGYGTAGQYSSYGSTGFGSLQANVGRISPACDGITYPDPTSASYPSSLEGYSDFFGTAESSSVAINHSTETVERINQESISYVPVVSDSSKNIIIVRHYAAGNGPDVILSTYYGDDTDDSAINASIPGMVRMTRHCKSGHTPKTTVDGSSNSQKIDIGNNAFNYSNIDLTTTPVTRDAALRYVTDRDWMQC